MAAVDLVARRRLAHQWRALTVAGVLLGLGFGLCLASFVAARRTASAYDRILAGADAPDAAVALRQVPGQPLEEAEQSLRAIKGITEQRVYAGFLGAADGVERSLSTALIAPIRDRFPIELPKLTVGRLPDPDAQDEVFVNASAAKRGGLEVGQRLRFRLYHPESPELTEADVTIVGIGTLPVEPVADETLVLGLFVFTRAFYEEHRDLVVYGVSNVYLAPGFDARRDLAPELGPLGDELQSARAQERQAVNEALRPIVIVLIVLGALAFGTTAVAAGQVVQRNRDAWFSDSSTARSIGMTRGQIRMVELASSGVIAAFAAATALLTMVLASPVAPVGPLHDLDPSQGVGIDGVVAAAGAAAIVATLGVLTLAFSSVVKPTPRPASARSPWLAALPRSAAAVAGLTLALRTDDGQARERAQGRGRSRGGRGWRAIGATTGAAGVLALSAVFVASAIALTGTPARYGFDADLLALNAYGDQSVAALDRAFRSRDDVLAATGFTSGSFLVDNHAVPGLAATKVKGELTPTILRGRPPEFDDEIVVGRDTLDSINADLGDVVKVQIRTAPGADGRPARAPLGLRIVGIATFPAVSQIGTDMPRLGTGALVTREAFLRMRGDAGNDPEFTAVRLVKGADPAAVRASVSGGFHDDAQTTTVWFTDAKPAEILQLDAAMPYLRGSLVLGFVILLAVIVHALWTLVRANRRDLAVLRAIGCTRTQMNAVTAWQVVPFVLGAVLVGIPIGIAFGRLAFARFAQSLAVVDDASTPAVMLASLVLAVLLAAAAAGVFAVAVARRSQTAAVLREG